MINVSGTENYYCGENLTGTNDVAPCLATAYSMATVNGIALMTLAIGLIGQSIVGSICLYKMQSAPTWSPNPIDIAAAVLSSGAIDYAICCSLRSVHDVKGLACPLTLRSKQGPAYFAHKQVRLVFYFVWATVVLVALWGGILMMVTRFVFLTWWYNHGKQNWSFFPLVTDQQRKEGGDYYQGAPRHVFFGQVFVKEPYRAFSYTILIYCMVQTLVALSLHCAELLVNVVRDELTCVQRGKRDSNVGTPKLLSQS